MKHVIIYRRDDITPLTVLTNARIRQIATAKELGLGRGSQLFIQIEREDYGHDYYLASAYRAMEVTR